MTESTAETEFAIPPALKQFDIWLLWTPEFGKLILAPWTTGHCYPASWGAQELERPETDFETANMIAELEPRRVHESYPFPDGDDGQPQVPEQLLPTILLPHRPPEPPVMLVDFDDVRDPQTGQVSDEVWQIIQRLDGFTEVSQSGAGLHVFVRAELPADLGKFIADLDTEGHIEMYDHGRVVGATWQHVVGTPMTVPERQDVVDALVEEYETSEHRKRRAKAVPSDEDLDRDVSAALRDDGSGSDRSPYFDVDIRSVADTGWFRRYRTAAPGDEWQGPHPEHGPQSSAPDDCTNFGIKPHQNQWYCFLHDSGGRAIELAAVLADATSITCHDVPARAARDSWLADHHVELLRTCLWLRDEAGVDGSADPPYAALLGVAEIARLETASADQLGRDAYQVARSLYDDLEIGSVDSVGGGSGGSETAVDGGEEVSGR